MPSPYYSDSFLHIGGFALNIKLSDDDMDTFYFCSGIGSITLLDELSEEGNYRSYFCTSCTSEGESRADIYILSENQLVGVVAGLMFRQTSKAALGVLLSDTPYNRLQSIAAQIQTSAMQPHRRELALIAETGVDPRNIEDSTNLSELGADSLMGIAIVRKTKADTGQILPMSIFSELRTIRDVQVRLESVNNKISPDRGPSEFSNKIVSEAGEKVSCPRRNKFGAGYPPNLSARPEDLTAQYRSNAVLLQRDAHSPTCPLILVAESNGSASIYTQRPTLGSSTSIWVLESPFLSCPTEIAYTPEETAPIYVDPAAVIQWQGGGRYESTPSGGDLG
ncbi:hypothetical protein ANO14919_028840 [Xylariales sp. No.14919]|nr:hypothetical protein ANO14919_028840 [Xylariales sp. No.14919]